MKKLFSTFLAFIVIGSLWSACNESTGIGSELIDDATLINTELTDTFSVVAHTVQNGPIPGSGSLRPYFLLGQTNDPFWGTSTANIYTQLRLGANDPQFGNNPVLDSIVLSLEYFQGLSYGDLSSSMSLNVYEVVDNSLQSDSLYNTDQEFQIGEKLGEKLNFRFHPNDSVRVANELVAPHIRINLSEELGNRFLAAEDDTSKLGNSDNLVKWFKGLYIELEPDESSNSIAYLDMIANTLVDLSRVTMYYHDAADATKDTLFIFPITTSAVIVNQFKQDYSGSGIKDVLDTSKPNSQNKTYLQGLTGVSTALEFPTLQDLGSNTLINKAKLRLTALPDSENPNYDLPGKVFFYLRDNETNEVLTTDLLYQEGTRQDMVDANGNSIFTYELPTSFFAQDRLLGDYQNTSLVVTQELPEGLSESTAVTNARTGNILQYHPSRVVFGGPEHPQYPMKLIVTYTKTD